MLILQVESNTCLYNTTHTDRNGRFIFCPPCTPVVPVEATSAVISPMHQMHLDPNAADDNVDDENEAGSNAGPQQADAQHLPMPDVLEQAPSTSAGIFYKRTVYVLNIYIYN